MFIQRLAVCTILVLIGAAPGLFFAWQDFDHAGIVTGVAVWIAIYTAVASFGWFNAEFRDRAFRRAFWITFGMRAALSIIPICFVMDMVIGLIALKVCSVGMPSIEIPGSSSPFWGALGATVVHGLIVNLLMLAFFTMVLASLRARGFGEFKGKCLTCGYDLRASPIRCPECGTPTPPVASSSMRIDYPL